MAATPKQPDRPREFTCANCRFFHPVFDGRGDCRRHPPRRFLLPEDADFERYDETLWPEVEEHHWCGELKRRDS